MQLGVWTARQATMLQRFDYKALPVPFVVFLFFLGWIGGGDGRSTRTSVIQLPVFTHLLLFLPLFTITEARNFSGETGYRSNGDSDQVLVRSRY